MYKKVVELFNQTCPLLQDDPQSKDKDIKIITQMIKLMHAKARNAKAKMR